MSENFLLPGEVVKELVVQWGVPPEKKPKCKTDQYMRMMELLYGRHENYKQWLKDPGLKKQMEMKLGYFVQACIGNLKNHTNYREGHETSLDGEQVREDGTKILYEVKIDERTTNDASLRKSIEQLQEAALKESGVKPLLIQFFRRARISKGNKYRGILISGEDYLNEYVSPTIGGVDGLISHMENHLKSL